MEAYRTAPRGRFAPSPSGRMHLGNLFAALLAWLSVRSAGGSLVLRIEDLDPERCSEELALQLADDLRWLGLDWDEGYGLGGAGGPYRQSERTDRYLEALEKLREAGVVYDCYCSRLQRLAASAPHRSDGQFHPCACRALTVEERQKLETAGKRPACRVALPDREMSFTDAHMGPWTGNLARDCGDFIIRRSDGVFGYQLAVVVDDAAMGVNQVVRGCDLLDSTPRQLFLYEKLGLKPPEFYHVPLLLAPDGRRLAKRDGDLDMGALRARYTPEELLGRLACLAGQLPTPIPVSAAELKERFSWDSVPKGDITVPYSWFGG